jgi:hypothetical protein
MNMGEIAGGNGERLGAHSKPKQYTLKGHKVHAITHLIV